MTEKWNPVDYHEHSYPQYAFALGLLERLRFNGDERILDVGCGDGKVTAALAARVPRGSVLGIDASPDMIVFARTMFPESAHPNLSFRYGDAAKLTFRHEFDIVVAFASLHWVKDLPTALRGIKQSLAPGGRFAAQLVAKRYATVGITSPLHRARKEVMDRPAWRTYFEGFEQLRAYSADECEQLLRDAGFVLQRCEFVTEEVTHQAADALKGYARSTWHRYTDRIPAQKQDALLNEVVQRCIELSPADRSGRIRVRASMLEVDATVAGTLLRMVEWKLTIMQIKYQAIGICGLSCRLCPMYNTQAPSRCLGCKSTSRMAVGCPFITCAVKKKGVEFCWECTENKTCEKWKKHREAGKKGDSFKCYQTLEHDISFIQERGISEFERIQKQREHLLKEMLTNFNEGRSRSFYCIAATVLDVEELKEACTRAQQESYGFDVKGKSKVLHSILADLAEKKGYRLTLRKQQG